jgi:hypothetical protein
MTIIVIVCRIHFLKFNILNTLAMRLLFSMICYIAFAVASQAHAQMLSKAADLKAEPAAEAKTVKSLPANSVAKIFKRQGFWVEIESGGSKGWIKLSDLNMSASGGASLNAMETGRTGKGNIVSTSAARGLSAKELVAAKPDPQQFEQLKALAVSASDAENFAQSSGLKSRTVTLLVTPVATASNTTAAHNSGSSRRKSNKNEDDDEDD